MNKAQMYISSSCLKFEKIGDCVQALAKNGIRNIELSGGTMFYQGYESDLLALKEEYDLKYIVHNYFPPPPRDFILNLASLNDDVFQATLAHYERALMLSRILGADRFGIHAGFLLDFSVHEIGRTIKIRELNERPQSIKRFCEGFGYLQGKAQGIKIYIENNVLSRENRSIFHGQNPFLFTDYESFLELKKHINFNILLDIGHLYVSANSLELDFGEEFGGLFSLTDYVHLSDNDGLTDENRCFEMDSVLLAKLKGHGFNDKMVTIEMNGVISEVLQSCQIVSDQLSLNWGNS